MLVSLVSQLVLVMGEWRETEQAHFVRKMNKGSFCICQCGYGLMKGANREKRFEDSAARIVLVERFDMVGDDMGFRYLIRNGLGLYNRIGLMREKRLKSDAARYERLWLFSMEFGIW